MSGCPGLSWRPCRSSRRCACQSLRKLKRRSWKSPLFRPWYTVRFGRLSPVDIIAHAILASLLARATATTRSGFLALMATIHSAKAPLCLWATRNTDVHPTTSIAHGPLGKRRVVLPPRSRCPETRFGRLRSYVRPLVRHRTAGPDDIRQPWSLSLRRAWELVTNVGVSWAFVATRRSSGSLPLARAIIFSRSSIFSSRPSLCEASIAVRFWPLRRWDSSALREFASNSLTRWIPLGAIKPNSESHEPRSAMTVICGRPLGKWFSTL